MADAKEKGLKHVDLWGVAPEDQPDHKWAGFTAFKKSFGGREDRLPGHLGPARQEGPLRRLPAGPEGPRKTPRPPELTRPSPTASANWQLMPSNPQFEGISCQFASLGGRATVR